MAKFIVKKASFFISEVVTPVAVTAITAGATTVLTVANSAAVGDIVVVTNSGWSSLDGKPGVVTTATASSLTVDIDTAAEATTALATAKASIYEPDNWVENCVSGLDIGGGAADSVSLATFCDSSAALAGAAGAQTATLTGFVDYSDPGFQEMQAAVNDGLPRLFRFNMPKAANPTGNPPVMYFNGTMSAVDESYQTGAAATFTAPVTLSARPTVII